MARPGLGFVIGGDPDTTRLRLRTLRAKTLLMIVVTLLGLMVVLYLPLRIILLGSFLSLEQQDIRQHVERAANALEDDIATLERTAGDYAGWDDTYAFMQDHNQDYITTNYIDETFAANRLSLVLLIEPSGKVVFGKGFDLISGQEQPIPDRLRAFSADDPLLRHPTTSSRLAGILLLPDGPMLVASQPILTSAYTGPIRGTVLMGRRLDTAEVQRLAETTRLVLSFYRPDDPQAPADISTARAALSGAATPIEQPLSEQTIAGYTMLPDIFGNPGLVLRVEASRYIYAQGKASMLYVLVSVLATGLVFGLVIMVLLERIILSRLSQLSRDVRQIGSSRDLTTRVAVAGKDEIALFAKTINAMLDTLEQSQAERRQAEEERAQIQEDMVRAGEQFTQMVVHDLKTPLTALMGFLDMLKLTTLVSEQRVMIESARRGANGMNDLIATILDTGGLAEGRLKLRLEPTAIVPMLRDCVADLKSWAEQDMHRIKLDLPQNIPSLMLDSRLMERVVINLLSNAIKHTPSGTTITLGARADETSLKLWVHDDGPGIPTAQQQLLFERFNATAGRNGRHTNTGLGLAFCKLAVEAHRGSIGVYSARGEGTTFTIELLAAELDLAAAARNDSERSEPV